MSKLKFRVVHSSSEDPVYPSSELNTHIPTTKGWQSLKFCPFPQELGFQLIDGDCKLSQVQILSHQFKIATKIEIYIGQGHDYHSATFRRLGYLSLDSNERSSYQARELKTVYIDQSGRFIKLLVHNNHVNKQNMYCQVGIVAVNLLGVDDDYSGRQLAMQTHGDSKNAPAKSAMNNPLLDLSVDLNLDPATSDKLRQLSAAKAKAVATEDYATAKKVKAVEGELKNLSAQLAKLDMAKREAVADEDYDKAKEIKDEVDSLKIEIEEKILAIHIPGVTDVRPMSQQQQHRTHSNHYAPDARRPSSVAEMGGRPQDRDIEEKNMEYRTIPMNIDDIPVGKRGGGPGPGAGGGHFSGRGMEEDFHADARFSSSTSSRKKSISRPGREDYDDDFGAAVLHDQGSEVAYNNQEEKSASQTQIGSGKSRGLRGKNVDNYDDQFASRKDPHIRDDDDAEALQNSFPEGEHPLEGVPNCRELSAPEGLKGKFREYAEQNGITKLLGEYRARCMFSKVWALRDAATCKIQLMLTDEFEKQDVQSYLPALSAIIRAGADDKIQQVMTSATNLLEAVLTVTRNAKLSRPIVTPIMDPVIVVMIEKLSDGNIRIREGARKGLEVLAASSNIGPVGVGNHAVKALSTKQASAWRPLSSRLQLLADLVATYGVGGGATSLSTESVMNFAKAAGAFTHSNAEVRDSAKELTVAVHAVVGPGPIDSYLRTLRKKQLEEYLAAFDAASSNGSHHVSRKQNDAHIYSNDHKTNNKDGGSSATKNDDNGHLDDQEEVPDFTSCMFCGDHDSKWNEDALDLHYWKDCALLAPCPACAQVVEVAGMPEHLLDECDQKDLYVSCDVTGLAVKHTDMAEWSSSKKCCPAPVNCMYCPLCLVSVEDTNETWKEHLIKYCTENKRGSTHK